MSLSDLINKVHGNESVSAMIDQYLMKILANPKPREFGWHPSEFVEMCPRRYVLSVLCQVKREPIEPGLQRIFDVGSGIHWAYQNRYFGPMKKLWGKWQCLRCDYEVWGLLPDAPECPACKRAARWEYLEVPVRAPLPGNFKKPIVGHSDGLLNYNGKWYVLELKSINDGGFTWMKRVRDSHLAQAQVYAELILQGFVDVPESLKSTVPEVSGILIMYVNKNFSREREFFIEPDQEFARKQLKLPYIAEMSFLNREFPSRLPVCKNLLRKPAADCSVGSYCFGGKSWGELSHGR
jgi:hypothetical protein